MTSLSGKTPVEHSRLKIVRLTADNGDSSFTCGDADLDEFLHEDAYRLDGLAVVRTYLAFHDETRLVGYISLLMDAVKLQPKERKKIKLEGTEKQLGSDDHPAIPALKVARLAVCQDFRNAHRGVGEYLMKFAVVMGLNLSKTVGCRLLTLDAYPQSEEFYTKLGFVRNKAKEYKEREHPSMRFDLFGKLPEWANLP